MGLDGFIPKRSKNYHSCNKIRPEIKFPAKIEIVFSQILDIRILMSFL